ncbi:MAG: bifunctional phosphoribosylaminoimidazolecarboxamide formyltransferase/IMP cyclohydrolase [Cyanobacteriota bacterium]|nr:bifunctional phosphoribosylaminoimidazolecarboxamide formyltransferase/IMP cyclohydrolase [Cyanobacteriota bacterium]
MPRLALISVSDKTGLEDLAKLLVEQHDFQIVSSGGTASALRSAGIPVTAVADYTGAPEMLGGRVKTLHPRIHGGILARLDWREDVADLEAQGILPISLVVVNLYPFQATIAQPDTTLSQAIEQIDIGGPTLIRAAAKNYAHVTVLTDPSQYTSYLEQLPHPSPAFRWMCAQQAFCHILDYDRAIADYFMRQGAPPTPPYLRLEGSLHQSLRYGENPHQAARWYALAPSGWHSAQQLQGKELSYNNLMDLEAARALAAEFPGQAAAVVVKHTNPCGVAVRPTLSQACLAALEADPVSAFGGIVALTQPLDEAGAEILTERFLECIVAPDCTPAAQQKLQSKKNLRVLLLAELNQGSPQTVRSIAGGLLVQEADNQAVDPSQWRVMTESPPTPEEWKELIFAWKVCKHVKSNAIVISKNQQTLGVGAGQMNRVGSVQIALQQAAQQVRGSVLASDGFFPFADSVKLAASAGIRVIVQPGGSLRDQDSIDAANQAGLSMVYTGIRHFLH